MDFKLFDPLNRYHGWPPAAVAGRVGDVDNAATDYLKLFFEKGGTPPGLLKTKQTLVDAQVESIRRRWGERYGGFEHWINPAVLDADAEYQKIGLTFQEMGFDVLDARNEARICQVLMVPPILVGAKIGLDRATYSNYAEARTAWWQDDLIPLYSNFTDVLDNNLGYEFGGGVSCQFDFSTVPALQEDRQKVWAISTEALTAGGITVNEFCAEVGLENKGPAGDVYLRAASTIEVPAKGPRPLIAATPVMEEEPEEEGESESQPAIEEGSGKAIKAKPPEDAATRRRHERVITAAMEEYFAEQQSRVIKEVGKNGR
jgi:phage portal protein BeeE